MSLPLTCHGVGGRGAGGGAGRADHAAVAAAGRADAAGAGAAVAAPLPALSGAAGPLPGAVLPDVVTHLGGEPNISEGPSYMRRIYRLKS